MGQRSFGGFFKGLWASKKVRGALLAALAAVGGYAASYFGLADVLKSLMGG